MGRYKEARQAAEEMLRATATQTQQETQDAPKRTGRQTSCTPEIAQKVADYIRQYGFFKLACDLAGISTVAAYEWIERGEADAIEGRVSPFAAFANAVKKARAEFQAEATRAIREGRQGWQSRAWLLERSDPEQYAIRQRVEHSGRVETGTAPVLSPAEWEARKRQILGGEDAATVH